MGLGKGFGAPIGGSIVWLGAGKVSRGGVTLRSGKVAGPALLLLDGELSGGKVELPEGGVPVRGIEPVEAEEARTVEGSVTLAIGLTEPAVPGAP